MSREALIKVAEVARMVQADCETDVSALDGKPFNGRTVAEALGAILAQISSNARAVEILAEEMLKRDA